MQSSSDTAVEDGHSPRKLESYIFRGPVGSGSASVQDNNSVSQRGTHVKLTAVHQTGCGCYRPQGVAGLNAVCLNSQKAGGATHACDQPLPPSGEQLGCASKQAWGSRGQQKLQGRVRHDPTEPEASARTAAQKLANGACHANNAQAALAYVSCSDAACSSILRIENFEKISLASRDVLIAVRGPRTPAPGPR